MTKGDSLHYILKLSICKMTQDKSTAKDIINRMKDVIGARTDVDLSNEIGGAKSQPAVWKKRGSVPLNACVSFALERDVSLDWLVLGRGEREASGSAKITHNDIEGNVVVPAYEIPGIQRDGACQSHWSIPRSSIEAAGCSVENVIVARAVSDANFGTIARGDSVLVDCRAHDIDGVFIVRFGSSVRIRRVQRMSDGSVRLSADNEAYEPEYLSAEAFAKVEVIGLCCAVLKRLS